MSGRELGLLPAEAFHMFSLLATRWLCSGAVPDHMCESRMVCLLKPGKIQSGNAVSVQHIYDPSPCFLPGGGCGVVLGPVAWCGTG